MQHRNRLRTACLSLAVACAIAAVGVPSTVYADEASDLANQLQQAQENKEQAKQELAQAQQNAKKEQAVSQELKNDEAALRGQINTIVGQISRTEQQIAEKQNEIAAKQAEIDQKMVKIDQKRAEIDQRWANFKERLAAMQVMHSGGTIALLGTATDISSFLTYSDNLQEISKYDRQVMDEMAAEKAQLEELKTQLEIQRTELETAQAALESQNLGLQNQKSRLDVTKAALSQQIQQQDQKVDAALADEQAAKEEYEAAYAIWQKAQEEFDRLANSNPGSAVVGDGTVMWPLPGYTRLSSYFGEDRELWPGIWSKGHGGVDVPAPAGTPIRVFKSGTVYNSYYSASYGNVVMVDHGNGLVSIYAHMTARMASVGSVVKVGDVIGTVGRTGQSTGNHLHFETRLNGTRVNPLNYISPS